MERQLITGIAHDKNEARITLTGLPDGARRGRRDLRPLADGGHQCRHDRRRASPSESHLHRPRRLAGAGAPTCSRRSKAAIGYAELATDTDICKVSIVGVGIRSDPARRRAGCSRRWPSARSTSSPSPPREIKVSVLIPRGLYRARRARAAHRLRARRGGRGLMPPRHPGEGRDRWRPLRHRP